MSKIPADIQEFIDVVAELRSLQKEYKECTPEQATKKKALYDLIIMLQRRIDAMLVNLNTTKKQRLF